MTELRVLGFGLVDDLGGHQEIEEVADGDGARLSREDVLDRLEHGLKLVKGSSRLCWRASELVFMPA